MKKRQFDKLLLTVVAKMAVKIKNPKLSITSTRPERKLVRNNKFLVKTLLDETIKMSMEKERDAK